MESVRNVRLGQASILICAVLWSTSGLCIKLIDWHPVVIAGLRSFFSAILMICLRFIDPNKRKLPVKLVTLLPAGFANAVTMTTFVIANKLTTSANVILLQYSAPIWASLLAWVLLKEKLSKKHWVALVLVMGGLVVFFKDALAIGSYLGDGIALFSGICFGSYAALLRVHKDGNPADAVIVSHILCALFSIPFIVLYPPVFTPTSVGSILFMGFIQTGLASVFFAYGIKYIGAGQTMLTAMIEPVLNPVWVLIVTGEKPALTALIGGSIIIAAVVVTSVTWRRRS